MHYALRRSLIAFPARPRLGEGFLVIFSTIFFLERMNFFDEAGVIREFV